MTTAKKTKRQIQNEALAELLDELETARCWFDDTAYPKRDREKFEKAVENVKKAFEVQQ